MSLYTHLSIDEREQIFLLHHQGDSIRMITKALKRSPSTISRELARNIEKQNYSPTIAQSKYTKKKSNFYRAIYRGDFNEANLSHGNRGAVRKLRHKGKTRHTKNHIEKRGKIS